MTRHSSDRFDIRFLARVLALAGTVVAVSVCGEQGGFGPTGPVNVNDLTGPVITVTTPTAALTVFHGDTIRVRAKAVDSSGIAVFGARLFVLDTVTQRPVTKAGDSITYTSRAIVRDTSFIVVVPANLAPGAYLLHVFAQDSSAALNDSTSADLTVNVRDVRKPGGTFNGPALDSQVVVGDTLRISFRATDNVGVASVRFRGYRLRPDPLLGPPDTIVCFDSLTARFPLLPADTSPIVRRLVPIVANETPDSVLIEARVTDGGGNDTTVTRRIQVIAGARAVTIQGPPVDTAVSAGDSVLVLFQVQDRRGITDVTVEGVALRGDSQLGTNEFVPRFLSRTISLNAVRDTTLKRYLKADSSDLSAEPVFVRVSFSGAAGDTTSALRRIQVVTGASVRLLSPADGLTHPVGAALPITVTGFDPDSVARLGFVSTGAIATRDSAVFTSPLSTAQSAALTLAVPNTAPVQSPDTITPFVVDRLGNRTFGTRAIVTFADSTYPTVTIASPTADTGVVAGDSVLVRVRLQDNRRGVAVSIDGGRFFSTVGVQGLNSTDTTVGRYLLFDGNLADAPDTASIIARITDGAGLQSADTLRIQVTSGPYVRITDPANGSQVRLGQAGASILPVVSAFNPDTITYLGFQATGRITKNDSMATTRPVTSTTLAQQLTLDVPDTTRLGTVTLTPFVRTRSGARLSGAAISVELVDGSLPVVRILTPARAGTDSIPAGDSLFVRVSTVDDRQLASLSIAGYARRPDVPDTLGSVAVSRRFGEKVVDLTGTVRDTVVRYLNAELADSTAENAYVVATATDAAGNVGVDTVKVRVIAGPSVRLTGPAAGLVHPVGTTLNVTVSGSDPHNLTYVGFVTRGVLARADSVAVSPAATTSTQTLPWAVAATAALGTDTLVPFARNAAGGRFYGRPVPIGLADNAAPTITVLGPALDTAVGVGDSVRVRVQVTDNRGIASVQMDGVQLQGDSALGTATLLTRLVLRTDALPRPTDTTLTRYLNAVQGQTGLGAIFIRVIATDSSGNQTTAWRRINFVAGPYVQISAPTAPAVQPIGATMSVTIVAYDPNGLTRVGFLASGAVSGGDSISYVSPLLTTQTTTRTLAIPLTARGTALVTPFSVDSVGSRLVGTALSVALSDTAKPTVSLDTPAIVAMPLAMSDSAYLSVHVTDNLGVDSVVLRGVALRGSVLLGTDTTVTRYQPKTVRLSPSSRDTVLKRYLNPLPTDATSELVYLIATAYDSSGNTRTDTASIRIVGGPAMTVVRPGSGATTSIGKSVIIELRAVDPNGVRLIGWRSSGVLPGLQDSTFFAPVSGNLADTATFTGTLVIPALTPLGTFTITPFGTDSIGDVSGTVAGVAVTVQSSVGDLTPPTVTFRVDRRIEIDDSVTVTATDAGGIRNIGFRVTALDTTVQLRFDSLAANLNGTLSDLSRTFALNLPNTLRYPSQVIVRGYGADSSGNRSFSLVAETLTVVAGKTYALPAGSQIADAIYNQRRRELYLSNFSSDRIEVFSLASNSFVASIPVGSRPWGLALWPRATSANAADTLYADTLIVANSGGTNLSIVDLVARIEVRRHRLPDYVVQTAKIVDAGAGGKALQLSDLDFSDRPEYVAAVCRAGGSTACDSVIAVYSTTPTSGQTYPVQRGYVAWENVSDSGATQLGTGHLFWEQAAWQGQGADTIQIIRERRTSAGVMISDTIVGAATGQRVLVDRLGFRDTTFVRNSGNFQRAVIGEGGGGLSLARVLAFDAAAGRTSVTGLPWVQIIAGEPRTAASVNFIRDNGISTSFFVQDFIGNRASNVTAVATNFNGTTNLVRADSIYVFDGDLRQTGMLQVSGAAHGMDVAPLHAFSANVRGTNTVPGDGDADARIVFAARPDSSIDVFDTYFFGEVTDTAVAGVPIPIRNSLVGAVRMTPDSGGTVLTGITTRGLVVVRLPTLTNPFPTSALPMPIVTVPEQPSRKPLRPAGRGTSPPNE